MSIVSYQSCLWNGFFKSNCVYLGWSRTNFLAQDFWLQNSRFKCSCIFIKLQQSLDRFLPKNLRSIRRICPGVKKSLIGERETSAQAVGRYYSMHEILTQHSLIPHRGSYSCVFIIQGWFNKMQLGSNPCGILTLWRRHEVAQILPFLNGFFCHA